MQTAIAASDNMHISRSDPAVRLSRQVTKGTLPGHLGTSPEPVCVLDS
jgi:hypothetical protein